MFNNIDEAARSIVDFCEQNKDKRSCIVILSEQTSEEDVSTIVAVTGKGGMLKGAISTALCKNKDLRSLMMGGFTHSFLRMMMEGEVKENPEEGTQEAENQAEEEK